MKLQFLPLVFILLLNSCATLFNGKEYRLHLTSVQSNSTVKIYDTIYHLPAKVMIKRSKENLQIVLESDGKEKKMELKAEPSRKFILGNLPFIYLWPISYGVDFTNQNRFYYGQNINLDINDTTTVLKKGFLRVATNRADKYFNEPYPGKKGQVNFLIGMPLVNEIRDNNEYWNRRSEAYGGVKVGLDYFYSDRKFLNLSAQTLFSFGIMPLGEYFDSYTRTSSSYISLTDNFAYKRFTFGYGLQFSRNQLKDVQVIGNAPNITTFYRNYAFGATVNSYFRILDGLHIGVVYRPDIYLVSPETKFNYGHVISGEIIWKFRLKK